MELIASLGWHQHGGSGLMITYSEILDLLWGDFVYLLEHIGDRRKAEADAIRKASKKG